VSLELTESETIAKGFIFDLDGTLFDSSIQILKAANIARESYNQRHLSKHEADLVIGLPASELFSDLQLTQLEVSEIVGQFRSELHKEVLAGNKSYPKAKSLLKSIKEAGHVSGVATSKPQYLAEAVVENSPLRKYLTEIHGTGPARPKPEPDVVLNCFKALGVIEAFMIGDRPEDVAAGIAAGVKTIGIAQTVFTKEELLFAGADYVYTSLSELRLDLSNLINDGR
jgi:HAD superfamily hydrolase (TIGR01549 family)